jgi:hypothetical protein
MGVVMHWVCVAVVCALVSRWHGGCWHAGTVSVCLGGGPTVTLL